jgi:hypothetical protein
MTDHSYKFFPFFVGGSRVRSMAELCSAKITLEVFRNKGSKGTKHHFQFKWYSVGSPNVVLPNIIWPKNQKRLFAYHCIA